MWLSVDAFAERVVSGETVEETVVVGVPLVSKGINDHRAMVPAGGVQVAHIPVGAVPLRNGVEVGKNLRGGSEIGPVNQVATIARVDIRSGDESHESCFYIAVFDGPSLCKIIATDDDSTFLKVEFTPEDGPQLSVTAINAERVFVDVDINRIGGVPQRCH